MNLQEFGVAFDPIDILSSWKISQRQEAATKLAADSVTAKSGTGSIGDCTRSKIGGPPPFPPQNNYRPYFGNNQVPVCGLMADLSSIGLFSKSKSPDCFLSTTNTSNTDSSAELDDVILSDDSKSLWNIHTNNAVSSGESPIDVFKSKPIEANHNNNIHYSVNELDQTVSRNNLVRSSQAKRGSHNAMLESGDNILSTQKNFYLTMFCLHILNLLLALLTYYIFLRIILNFLLILCPNTQEKLSSLTSTQQKLAPLEGGSMSR